MVTATRNGGSRSRVVAEAMPSAWERVNMRALVTGCAGFIGSHLTESLVADGHEVVGVDCFSDNYVRSSKLENLRRAREFESFEFVPIDLARGDLADIVAGCEVIFHLAAEPGVRSSWGDRFDLFVRNNVVATQRLLEAAREKRPRRLVFASSSSIYGNAATLPTPEEARPRPFSPYGVTKLSGEHLCQLYDDNHGLDAVALRYFTVYGPRQRPDMALNRFCRAALTGGPITLFGDGTQRRDFTFVGDVVAATRAAASRPGTGRAYNVGGGSRVSVNRALELLAGLAGRPLDVRRVPTEAGDVRETGADISRAARELGYAPRTPFADGLEAELEWTAARLREPAMAAGRRGSPAPRNGGAHELGVSP
jgi:UDP-glucuronate 4-epimerase